MARKKTETDTPTYYEAYIIEDGTRATDSFPHVSADGSIASEQSGNRALLKVVFGALLVMAGIPMLVLPGPGLLCIGVGAALVATGTHEFGSKKRGVHFRKRQ